MDSLYCRQADPCRQGSCSSHFEGSGVAQALLHVKPQSLHCRREENGNALSSPSVTHIREEDAASFSIWRKLSMSLSSRGPKSKGCFAYSASSRVILTSPDASCIGLGTSEADQRARFRYHSVVSSNRGLSEQQCTKHTCSNNGRTHCITSQIFEILLCLLSQYQVFSWNTLQQKEFFANKNSSTVTHVWHARWSEALAQTKSAYIEGSK